MCIGIFELLPLLILIVVVGLIFFFVQRQKDNKNKGE